MEVLDETEHEIINKLGTLADESPNAPNILIFNLNHTSTEMSPPLKKMKTEICTEISSFSLKNALFKLNKHICDRLDVIEEKLADIEMHYQFAENKLAEYIDLLKNEDNVLKKNVEECSRKSQDKEHETERLTDSPTESYILEIPNKQDREKASVDHSRQVNSHVGSPGITLITLNTEAEFPDGSWLGDPDNQQMRVRCKITPKELSHINNICKTPEKMALTLLDHLFDRSVQATSNINGRGRHGKSRLDPLRIYGIQCHLIYKFAIDDAAWHRIKLNIDSKCRTQHRRKERGMPLIGIQELPQHPLQPHYVYRRTLVYSHPSLEDNTEGDYVVQFTGVNDESAFLAEISSGDVQVVQATEEDLCQFPIGEQQVPLLRLVKAEGTCEEAEEKQEDGNDDDDDDNPQLQIEQEHS